MNMRINRGWIGMTALAIALSLQGCGGDEDTTAVAKQIVVNTPAQIAQVSADSYDENVNGLITAATLKRWKDDWPTERAKLGLTGKLVILQISAGPAGAEYIKQDGVNVFTYQSLSSDWTQVRTNGVIETIQVVPDGAQMDGILKKYNIDPMNDMIVAAMGTGGTGAAMAQGRIWYALRYWGVDKKNLALLNGGNAWTPAGGSLTYPAGFTPADFQVSAAGQAVVPGTHSVRELLVDNTQLQATLDDMMRILPASDTNLLNDGVFIWDARRKAEYDGTAFTPNGGSRQGHPNGALELDYVNMLDAGSGYSYQPKSVLEQYLNGEEVGGVSFIAGNGAGDYTPVGIGNAYQPGDTVYTYCETTFRAMITGVASAVILGKPTRFYDGAMVEWNSLSYIADKNGNYILPSTSPWRTDKSEVSFFVPQTDSTLINPRTITGAFAESANEVVNADKAYKLEPPVSTGTSGGGAAPVNPCGG